MRTCRPLLSTHNNSVADENTNKYVTRLTWISGALFQGYLQFHLRKNKGGCGERHTYFFGGGPRITLRSIGFELIFTQLDRDAPTTNGNFHSSVTFQ